MRRKSAREVLEAAAVTQATVVESLKQQRDTYQARLVERIEEVESLTFERDALRKALADAERRLAETEGYPGIAHDFEQVKRHREVLAKAMRKAGVFLRRGRNESALPAMEAALRECGLLRPQDGPEMVPEALRGGQDVDSSLAYRHGRKAAVEGLSRDTNRYYPSTPEYEEWNRGWCEYHAGLPVAEEVEG